MADALRNLAWDDFRLVKAVADARGLTGAAERLGVNHSTTFRRLGQIEDALGVALFERHRTGYALTEYTEHFFIKDDEFPYEETQRFDWIRGYHVGGRSLLLRRQPVARRVQKHYGSV